MKTNEVEPCGEKRMHQTGERTRKVNSHQTGAREPGNRLELVGSSCPIITRLGL